MAIYEVQTPTGQILEIEGPEGANESELLSFVAANWKPDTSAGGGRGATVRQGEDGAAYYADSVAKQMQRGEALARERVGAGAGRGVTLEDDGDGPRYAGNVVAQMQRGAQMRKQRAIEQAQQNIEALPTETQTILDPITFQPMAEAEVQGRDLRPINARRTPWEGRLTEGDIPDMTATGLARDIGSGAAQIPGVVVSGAGQLGRLASMDMLGKDLQKTGEGWNQAIRRDWMSDRARAQAAMMAQDMEDPAMRPDDVVLGNKGAIADMALPQVGSMLLPIGAAAGAAKLAQAGNAAKLAGAIAPELMAARVGAAQTAAVSVTSALQNAAEAYSESKDQGAGDADAYKGAAIAAGATLLANKLTGGGVEAAIAKGQLGKGANVLERMGAVALGAGKEFAQEGGEGAGGYIGKQVALGREIDANDLAKNTVLEGTMGALMGGGGHAVGAVRESIADAMASRPAPAPAPKVEDQPTTPQAPTAPPPVAPKAQGKTAQDLAAEILQAEGEPNGTALQAQQTETQGQEAPASAVVPPPVTQPAQPAANAGQGAGVSQPTQEAPKPLNVTDLDPGQLLRVMQSPEHPLADAARAELKRREVEYLYQQREAQQQAQREADARPLMDEAADQQVAQADAVVDAASLDAPTAMAQAFARAKAKAPVGLAAELEAIKNKASNTAPPLASAGSVATKPIAPEKQKTALEQEMEAIKARGMDSAAPTQMAPADLTNYVPAWPKSQSSMDALAREVEAIKARNGYPAAPAATTAPDSAAAVGMPAPVAAMPPVAAAAPAMPAAGAIAKAAKTVAAPIPGGGFSSPETMAVDGKDVSTLAPAKGYEPNSEFALGMPTFKGNKRTMLGMAVSAVRQHMDGGSKITQVDDWFGGGGMWSTALANATLPNVKKIRIAELNPLRIKRIQWMHERGDKMFDDMQRTGALKVYRNLLAEFKANVDPKTGAAAPIVSPSPFEQIGLSLAGVLDNKESVGWKRAVDSGAVGLSDEGKIILSTLGDLAFNNRGAKIHQASRLVLPDGTVADKFLAKAMYEMAAAHKQAQAFKARGGVYEYFPAGSSFDLVRDNAVQGDHVLSLADPPYYNTSGYKGAGSFSTGDKWNANGYAASRDLLKTLVDKGNHILYTDEAWWRKDDQLPDANQAGAILGQINQHLSGLHVAPEKVGGRYEQLGIHNPNARRGGNSGGVGSEVQREPIGQGDGRGVLRPNGQMAPRAGSQGGGTAGAPGLKFSTAAPAELESGAGPKYSVAPRNLDTDITLEIPVEGGAQRNSVAQAPTNHAFTVVPKRSPEKMTVTEMRSALDRRYPGVMDGLESKGLLRLVQTHDDALTAISEARAQKLGGDAQAIRQALMGNYVTQGDGALALKRSTTGVVQAFYDPVTGQAFMVSDAMTMHTAPGVLMHEVGIHMAADGSMQPVFTRASQLLKMGGSNPFMRKISQRMKDAGETSGEEAAAYITEEYENDPGNAPDSVKNWITSLYAAIRAWMFRKGVLITADHLTPADIAAVARANAKALAETGQAAGGEAVALSQKAGAPLLAPNGKPSKLTPGQHAQVRTQQFKAWFGDWENDPENASKAVDENGEPLVLFHGTKADISAFERNHATEKDSGWYGRGIYFTADPNTASAYSGFEEMQGKYAAPGANVVSVFSSIKNPYIWPKGRKAATTPSESDAIRRELEAAGHDGVFVPNEYADSAYAGHYEVVNFDPTQIKSAIGNNGQFDPANPDIRFSRAATTSQHSDWTAPKDTITDKVLQKVQDSRIDLKRAQQAIEEHTGKGIEEKFDARLAETLYMGRVADRVDVFMKSEAEPLLKAMAAAKVSQTELSDYLLARHAPEANAQIAKINPELPDGGAGTNSQGVLMTTQAAQDYIANLSPGRKIALDLLAKRVDAMTAETRRVLVDEGLETQEAIDAWTGAYKHYVPLFKDEAMEGTAHPRGTGFSVKGAASKRRTGGTGEVTNMLAHVLMQREAALTRAEKNRVGMSLYGLALTNPNPDFWTTIKPNMKAADIEASLTGMGVDPANMANMDMAPTLKVVDKSTGMVRTQVNPLYKNLPNALVVKVAGQDRVLMFNANDERAMRLVTDLKNLDGAGLEMAQKTVGVLTRGMAKLATQYNVAFGPVNLVRDVLGTTLNLTSTELAGSQLQVLRDLSPAAYGIATDLAQGGKAQGEWSKLFRQFKEDGGKTGYLDSVRDPKERSKQIESALARMERSRADPREMTHAVLDLIGGYNETLENATRLAVYKAGLDKGLSRAKAARVAREITVDFNRKGAATKFVSPFYAFANAAIQGTARTLQTLSGPKGKAIIAGGLALGMVQAVALAAAGFDDDEIAEFAKARALIIPIGKDKNYIQIPLQLGLHILPNTGRVMMELYLSGGKDAKTKITGALAELVGAFNPLGGGDPLSAIVPTVLDPVVDLARNKSFTGSRISSEPYPNDARPGYMRGRESTMRLPSGEVYKGIAKAVNRLSLGSDTRKGEFSPTPEQVRYFVLGYTGGVLRELEKTTNASIMADRGDDVPERMKPVIGRFYGEVDDDQVQQSRYIKNQEKVQALAGELAILRKGRDSEGMRKLQAQEPTVRLDAYADNVQRQLSALGKQARDHMDDQERLHRIDRQRTEIMRKFNARIQQEEAKHSQKQSAYMPR